MKKNILVGFIFIGVGCQAGAASASQNLVFYTEQQSTGCLWQLLNPYTHAARTIYETPECPEKIVWDMRHHQTFYTVDASSTSLLYKVFWKNHAQPVSLGPREDIVDLWISRDTGRLRRALFIETESANTMAVGTTTYFLYKGGRYPTEQESGDGIIGMAVVEEQTQAGNWIVIGAKSTNWGAGDSLGMSAVESLMAADPLTVTLQTLLQKATCAYQGCPSDFSQAPAAVKDRLETLFPGLKNREDDEDGLVYKSLTANEELLFATGMGDTVHAEGPVYYCSHQCQMTSRLEPASDFSQLSVSTQGACALFAEEYTGDNASIVCAGSAGIPFTLKKSHSAVWFPLPI